MQIMLLTSESSVCYEAKDVRPVKMMGVITAYDVPLVKVQKNEWFIINSCMLIM